MELKVRRISKKAVVPSYAHKGDACFDLRVLIDDEGNKPFRFSGGDKVEYRPQQEYATDRYSKAIQPGETLVFHTGLAFSMPEGYVMKAYVRSSTGIKNHLMLSNGTGVIDSAYRGEVMIALTNHGKTAQTVTDGDRVAQAEICRVLPVEITEVETLDETERGEGGIGSTGKN